MALRNHTIDQNVHFGAFVAHSSMVSLSGPRLGISIRLRRPPSKVPITIDEVRVRKVSRPGPTQDNMFLDSNRTVQERSMQQVDEEGEVEDVQMPLISFLV